MEINDIVKYSGKNENLVFIGVVTGFEHKFPQTIVRFSVKYAPVSVGPYTTKSIPSHKLKKIGRVTKLK